LLFLIIINGKKLKSLAELIESLEIAAISGNTEIVIEAIEYDSRKCKPGTLFAALCGTQVNGHDYISKAVANGAVAVLCEEIPNEYGKDSKVTFVCVKNSRAALAQIAHAFYDYPTRDMLVVGITGTNGKTTTTFLLKSIFEKAGLKSGIVGTTGIYAGDVFLPATHTTPESIELAGYFSYMKQQGVQAVAIETSSHALHQHRADCIDYNAALFTNLTHEHLDYHKTMDEYADAKKLLFDMLGSDAFALVCDESEYAFAVTRDTKARKFTIGRKQSSNFRIFMENMQLHSSEFFLEMPDLVSQKVPLGNRVTKFSTILPGSYNIDNAACAVAAAFVLGIKTEDIFAGLASSTGAPGRMERVMLRNGALAIVDYAHSPDALEKALNACRGLQQSAGIKDSRLICVFGCGGDRDKTKRPLMGAIAASLADIAVVTSDNPRTEDPEEIIDNIFTGIDEAGAAKTVRIADRAKAIQHAAAVSKENDIILVAGKGHEDYQILGTTKIHFDDAEELKRY